ncbi:hypothetical protein TPA0906_59610 [Streptomyces olivaceus]|nr:hypothetical protein TPA0906_59610 [Streptomyces olivaceus]
MSSVLQPVSTGGDPSPGASAGTPHVAPLVASHDLSPGPTPAGTYRPVSSHLAIAPPVSVVIPAMNEAENLPYVFKTLPDWIHEVVLVDGNSTDATVEVARELWPGVKVVGSAARARGTR